MCLEYVRMPSLIGENWAYPEHKKSIDRSVTRRKSQMAVSWRTEHGVTVDCRPPLPHEVPQHRQDALGRFLSDEMADIAELMHLGIREFGPPDIEILFAERDVLETPKY